MFHLVRRRYIFLAISGLVILPGIIFLAIFHLKVGIDFAGGSTMSLRPAQALSVADARSALNALKLQDLQINNGDNISVPGNQTVWVRLNTTVDGTVQTFIKQKLQGKYGSQIAVSFSDLPLKGKTVTVVTITKFQSGVTPKIADIKELLGNLPKTTDTTKPAVPPGTTGTPSANGTPVVTTGTPQATPTQAAKPTPTPKATATPTAKGTPTATVTPTTTPPNNQGTTYNPANTTVKVADVTQGKTTQTINLLTSTFLSSDLQTKVQAAFFNNRNVYVQTLETATVQGSVASDTQRNAILAVAAASVLILLYVWFAFRKVARPWRYGACAIIALLHDVLVVLGVSSILGYFFDFRIDALFITALLTVVGFSVHDTIVVFDRIRENMQRRTVETFEEVVNASLVQTMARSLNTSLTVLFTLSALTLFGGTTIRAFTGTLLLGIFSGTYSSIFNASMLLVIWEKGELGLGRFRRRDVQPDGRGARQRELARSRG